MRILASSIAGLVLAATAAHAQPVADEPGAPAGADPSTHSGADAAVPPDATDPATDAAAAPADALPADTDAAATAAVTDADIDSFAKATVKLQEIQADTEIAADQKQTAMAAAVAEAGLDPAKYNEIGKAVESDATLRARVQTAMSKYAQPPSQG